MSCQLLTNVFNLTKTPIFPRICSIQCHKLNIKLNRHYSNSFSEYDNKDPAPLFFNDAVQSYLKVLTGINFNKVFRKKCYGGNSLEAPVYKFMTTEQLDEAMEVAKRKAENALQMPPVVQVSKEKDVTLSCDYALTGYDTSKYIFTDITYGLTDSNRIIISREPNGELKHAGHEIRQRINQTYFPIPGRKITIPKLFEESYLKLLLERHEYEYVLDRACIQFDPDNLDYHRITTAVYNHINELKQFDILRSTRHFGPLLFYLCWIKSIDNLLLELIQTEKIFDTVCLISLFYIINSECTSNINNRTLVNVNQNLEMERAKFNQDANSLELSLEFVDSYAKTDSLKKSQIELALQAFKELKQKNDVYSDIHIAHTTNS